LSQQVGSNAREQAQYAAAISDMGLQSFASCAFPDATQHGAEVEPPHADGSDDPVIRLSTCICLSYTYSVQHDHAVIQSLTSLTLPPPHAAPNRRICTNGNRAAKRVKDKSGKGGAKTGGGSGGGGGGTSHQAKSRKGEHS
jgi:uncharacterized membrane protein YgcG